MTLKKVRATDQTSVLDPSCIIFEVMMTYLV